MSRRLLSFVAKLLSFVAKLLLTRNALFVFCAKKTGDDKKGHAVFIVEEHHEVLAYWEKCLVHLNDSDDWKDRLGLTGNATGATGLRTLLHVDAHSDMAHPLSLEPVHHWYERIHSSMMQENDNYIIAAAYAGAFDRIIWLHPKWIEKPGGRFDDPRRPPHDKHFVRWIRLGHATAEFTLDVLVSQGLPRINPSLIFCFCETDFLYSDKSMNMTMPPNEWNYVFCGSRHLLPDGRRIMLKVTSPSQCSFQRVLQHDILTLEHALNWYQHADLAQEHPLIHPGTQLFLNIDEDFFGVESSQQRLFDMGLTQANYDKIDTIVEQGFCPLSHYFESSLDLELRALVASVQEHCSKVDANAPCIVAGSWVYKWIHANSYREESMLGSLCAYGQLPGVNLSEALGRNSKVPITPSFDVHRASSNDRLNALKALKKLLLSLAKALADLHQISGLLSAIEALGFCFYTTPRSTHFDGTFKVCTGPNSAASFASPLEEGDGLPVVAYTPDRHEIDVSMKALGQFLKSGAPLAVCTTVCRSIRDGYTPRHSWRYTEKHLLEMLNHVNTHYNLLAPDIVFDAELLGTFNRSGDQPTWAHYLDSQSLDPEAHHEL